MGTLDRFDQLGVDARVHGQRRSLTQRRDDLLQHRLRIEAGDLSRDCAQVTLDEMITLDGHLTHDTRANSTRSRTTSYTQ